MHGIQRARPLEAALTDFNLSSSNPVCEEQDVPNDIMQQRI